MCICILQENFCNAVIGTVVLTDYNNNTYRIEDVDFSASPSKSFPLKNGENITYIDYYRKKYDIRIRNPGHPMLVTKSKTKDRQAGEGERVYLVPELCRATGTLCFIDNFHLLFFHYFFYYTSSYTLILIAKKYFLCYYKFM